MEKYDFVYEGARQGGHLAYLPDMQQGILRPLEEFLPEWSESLGKQVVAPHLGGLKIDAAWLQDRFNWRDANGVPQKPVWTNDENMEDLRLKQQLDLRRQKLEEDDILICVDEEEIFEEHAEILQDHPAFRHMKFTKMLEKMEADESKVKGGLSWGTVMVSPDVR